MVYIVVLSCPVCLFVCFVFSCASKMARKRIPQHAETRGVAQREESRLTCGWVERRQEGSFALDDGSGSVACHHVRAPALGRLAVWVGYLDWNQGRGSRSIKEEDGDRIGEEEELKGDWDWGFD
jgi:hypothetical protein